MALDLPAPLSAYFDATSRHDVDRMLSAFADGATVHDEAQDIRGSVAIRQWISDTIERYDFTATPIGVTQSDDRIVVATQVSGTFPGSPVELQYRFAIAGAKITALEIE